LFLLPECAANSIFVENKYIIPDSSFTATTFFDNRYVPSNGRLNSATHGWGPKTNAQNDHLQIDLGLPYIICAIATQGSNINAEWVKTYKISVSLDNSNWTTYQESGADKV
jgi:hypothetical protein